MYNYINNIYIFLLNEVIIYIIIIIPFDGCFLTCGSSSSGVGAFKQTQEATSRPSPMGNTMTAITIPVDLSRPSAVVVAKKGKSIYMPDNSNCCVRIYFDHNKF